jgi:hypothetical protein
MINNACWTARKITVIFVRLITLEFSRQVLEKYSNTKFHENPSSGGRVVLIGRTDMTKLIVTFQNFANAPKKCCYPTVLVGFRDVCRLAFANPNEGVALGRKVSLCKTRPTTPGWNYPVPSPIHASVWKQPTGDILHKLRNVRDNDGFAVECNFSIACGTPIQYIRTTPFSFLFPFFLPLFSYFNVCFHFPLFFRFFFDCLLICPFISVCGLLQRSS